MIYTYIRIVLVCVNYLCLIFVGIVISFDHHSYEVHENDGPAEPVLHLSKPSECCSFSVQIKVLDATAIGKFVYTESVNTV